MSERCNCSAVGSQAHDWDCPIAKKNKAAGYCTQCGAYNGQQHAWYCEHNAYVRERKEKERNK